MAEVVACISDERQLRPEMLSDFPKNTQLAEGEPQVLNACTNQCQHGTGLDSAVAGSQLRSTVECCLSLSWSALLSAKVVLEGLLHLPSFTPTLGLGGSGGLCSEVTLPL